MSAHCPHSTTTFHVRSLRTQALGENKSGGGGWLCMPSLRKEQFIKGSWVVFSLSGISLVLQLTDILQVLSSAAGTQETLSNECCCNKNTRTLGKCEGNDMNELNYTSTKTQAAAAGNCLHRCAVDTPGRDRSHYRHAWTEVTRADVMWSESSDGMYHHQWLK